MSNVINIEDRYYQLENEFFVVIKEFIQFMYNNELVPRKLFLFQNYILSYIDENKIEIMQQALTKLLPMKDDILDFEFENLQNVDDFDNMSHLSTGNINSGFIQLIIEVKHKAINLSKTSKKVIKQFMEIIILILEQIQILF